MTNQTQTDTKIHAVIELERRILSTLSALKSVHAACVTAEACAAADDCYRRGARALIAEIGQANPRIAHRADMLYRYLGYCPGCYVRWYAEAYTRMLLALCAADTVGIGYITNDWTECPTPKICIFVGVSRGNTSVCGVPGYREYKRINAVKVFKLAGELV